MGEVSRAAPKLSCTLYDVQLFFVGSLVGFLLAIGMIKAAGI